MSETGIEIFPVRHLDSAGRCCGRKPLLYKRDRYRFCPRCDAAYLSDAPRQIGNWAWKPAGNGFIPTYPKSDAVDFARASIAAAQEQKP